MSNKFLLFELEESAIEQVGIKSIVISEEGIMYITLTSGEVITSPSLKGPKGDKGIAGSVDDVKVNGTSVLDADSVAQISLLTEEQAVSYQTETIQILLDKLTTDYYDITTIQSIIENLDTQIQSAVVQTDNIYQNTINFISTFTNNLRTALSDLNEYVYVNNNTLHLGKTDGTIRLTLSNGVFTMLYNSTPIMTFQNDEIKITKTNITDSLRIGNFVLSTQKDGSIALIKSEV